jgi:flagellar biosynthesis protein FlhB
VAEQDEDQKTEQPTSKRLERSREEGKLPISREVGYWTSLVAILSVIAWFSPSMAKQLIMILRVFIESPHAFVVDDHGLQTIVLNSTVQVMIATGLIFLVIIFSIIVGFMVQTGFFASTSLITPDFGRISFIGGVKRLFSLSSVVELIKSFGKLIVLGTAAYYTLMPLLPDLPGFVGRPIMDTVAYMHDKSIHLVVILLLIFTAIAIGDYFYQQYTYIKGLKMTKQEVKDEYKQQEGDPIIKGRLRQIRIEKARRRMMAQVPKADVVITNPTHYAIALKYDSAKSAAPVVLAKGLDRIAEKIREIAEENKITLVSNPPLARALYDTVEIDKEIPTQHYRAVAEIISYVYKLKKRGI